jgi:hypothetical protein
MIKNEYGIVLMILFRANDGLEGIRKSLQKPLLFCLGKQYNGGTVVNHRI